MTLARRISTCGALVLSLLACAHAVSAQGEDYGSLIEAYAHGDTDHAVAAFAGWPAARLRTAFDRTAVTADRARAAMMLHAETALAVGNHDVAYLHLARARAVFNAVPKEDRNQRLDAFIGRWTVFEALVYGSYGDMRTAQNVLDAALRADIDNVDALLAQGALDYTLLSANEPNPRGRWNGHNIVTNFDNLVPAARRSEDWAVAGHDAFSALVRRHPESLEARLRFGWALLINHSPANQAREQLDVVAAGAQRDDLRYLAHLFLGAVEASDGHLDKAAAEYAQAKAILPRQAAYAALIQIDRELGFTDASERLAVEFASSRPALDPWGPFNAGLTDGEMLEWLRKEARVP